MSITAKELSQMLGLSEAAVSLALNNKPGVSTKTRQMVQEAARKGGYDFTRINSFVETKADRGTISFLIVKKHGAIVTDSPFFSQLTEGVERFCRKSRYQLNVQYLYVDGDKRLQLDTINGNDGIILLATEMKAEDFQKISEIKKPIVVLDSYFEDLPYDCVLINNFQGAYKATRHLIQKTKSQPGYLHSSYPIANFDERSDGFFKAVRESGYSLSKTQVLKLAPSMEGAYNDMLDLLNEGEQPSRCYFADNDLIAAGAMKALKEKGYRIPEDVSIIGFDNMPLCTYVEPTLTTINVPKHYMGELAVQRLLQRMEHPEFPAIKIEVSTTLTERKSLSW